MDVTEHINVVKVIDEILVLLYEKNTVHNLKRLLSERHLDINFIEKSHGGNWSILLRAILWYPTTIRTLLECGANPLEKFDDVYETPFHAAVSSRNPGLVKLFIQYSPTLPTGLLEVAVQRTSFEIIEMIMDAGESKLTRLPPPDIKLWNPEKGKRYRHVIRHSRVIESRIKKAKEAIYALYLLKNAYNKDVLFMVSRLVWKERRNKVWN